LPGVYICLQSYECFAGFQRFFILSNGKVGETQPSEHQIRATTQRAEPETNQEDYKTTWRKIQTYG